MHAVYGPSAIFNIDPKNRNSGTPFVYSTLLEWTHTIKLLSSFVWLSKRVLQSYSCWSFGEIYVLTSNPHKRNFLFGSILRIPLYPIIGHLFFVFQSQKKNFVFLFFYPCLQAKLFSAFISTKSLFLLFQFSFSLLLKLSFFLLKLFKNKKTKEIHIQKIPYKQSFTHNITNITSYTCMQITRIKRVMQTFNWGLIS